MASIEHYFEPSFRFYSDSFMMCGGWMYSTPNVEEMPAGLQVFSLTLTQVQANPAPRLDLQEIRM